MSLTRLQEQLVKEQDDGNQGALCSNLTLITGKGTSDLERWQAQRPKNQSLPALFLGSGHSENSLPNSRLKAARTKRKRKKYSSFSKFCLTQFSNKENKKLLLRTENCSFTCISLWREVNLFNPGTLCFTLFSFAWIALPGYTVGASLNSCSCSFLQQSSTFLTVD